MGTFDAVERADNWMARVCDWIHYRVRAVDTDAWNYDPALRLQRERATRVLVRSANKLDREVTRAAAAGVPREVTGARLRTIRQARDRARVRG